MRTGIYLGRGAMIGGAVAALLSLAGVADAQTWNCAADSLPLVSPPSISVELTISTERIGNTLQWDELDPSQSTCSALVDTAGVGIDFELSGDYLDTVDREFLFTAQRAGAVGSTLRDRVPLRWNNFFVSRSGTIVGEINLSNTGGIWRRSVGGAWAQENDGLPMNLPYTNVIALGLTPAGDGLTRYVALSGGASTTTRYRGLYQSTGGGDFLRISEEVFPDDRGISAVAVSPTNRFRFAVGTTQGGVFVTDDGGATFTQFTDDLDPDGNLPTPTLFDVTALLWTENRLYVAVRAYGIFSSIDNGVTFAPFGDLLVPENLDVPGSPDEVAQVLRIVEDPENGSHVVVGLRDHALYHTPDAGGTWLPLAESLTVVVPETPDAWRYTGLSLYLDPRGGGLGNDLYVLGTSQKGLWRSEDGGASWIRVADAPDLLPQEVSISVPVNGLLEDPDVPGRIYAAASGLGLLRSADQGVNWIIMPDAPVINTVTDLIAAPGGGFYLASFGGGIFLPNSTLDLSSTVLPAATDDELDDLELGLALRIGTGAIDSLRSFRIKAQNFQGWMVWRSIDDNPNVMEMIGRYDRTNPESCIQGFCGDDNFSLVPNCFSERRAACFDLSTPGQVSFYDADIYNGFTYFYAVTTFDYGNTAGVAPASLTRQPIISPRYQGDDASPFSGAGNRSPFQVNLAAQPPQDGPEIYAYPNPLRQTAGFPGQEGEQVVFTNLPPRSQIHIFTLAGDEVAVLGEAEQVDSNIYWFARNKENEELASGIYIWKVEMEDRGDFWGKLVIIR